MIIHACVIKTGEINGTMRSFVETEEGEAQSPHTHTYMHVLKQNRAHHPKKHHYYLDKNKICIKLEHSFQHM